jgi:DNA-directed RNA polymerase specialized sigma24 family protein
LFTAFTASTADSVSEDVARQAFALLQRLDSAQVVKPPTLLTVFRLYCIDELSAAAIAHKCRCSKATIIRRLELIHDKTSLDPQRMRRISSHLDQIDTDIAESGAAHIHRRRLIYDADEEDER